MGMILCHRVSVDSLYTIYEIDLVLNLTTIVVVGL